MCTCLIHDDDGLRTTSEFLISKLEERLRNTSDTIHEADTFNKEAVLPPGVKTVHIGRPLTDPVSTHNSLSKSDYASVSTLADKSWLNMSRKMPAIKICQTSTVVHMIRKYATGNHTPAMEESQSTIHLTLRCIRSNNVDNAPLTMSCLSPVTCDNVTAEGVTQYRRLTLL